MITTSVFRPLKVISVFFILIGAVALKGQHNNLIISKKHNSFSHQYTFEDWDYYKFIDTSFNSLENYHQWNNSNSDIFGSAELTNIGGALQQLTSAESKSIWSYYDQGAFANYFLEQNDVPYYYVKSALTEAQYFMGYNRGHVFNIYHTQNVNKYLNFYVKYKRLNSLGFYANDVHEQSSFLGGANYSNPKTGYAAKGYILTERLINDEFGGLRDDSLRTEVTRDLLPVNLSADGNTDANRQFYFDNSYDFARFFTRSSNDSLKTTEERSTAIRLGASFKYKRMYSLYTGQSSGFYDNYFSQQAGLSYTDSVANQEYVSRAYLETTIGNTYRFKVKGGISHLFLNYGNDNFRFESNNLGIFSLASVDLSERLALKGSLDYIFSGSFSQNVDMKVQGDLKLLKWLNAFGGYSFVNRNADVFDLYYFSNNFIWNNDFDKQRFLEFHYGIKWLKENSLRITQKSIFNYIYYDADALPAQANETVNVLEAKLTQNFTFWNLIHFDNDVVWQRVTSNSGVMPLPELVSRNSLYLEFGLFKKAMKLLLGSEMNYFSSYLAPSFNPATSRFYLENRREIGGYPYFDAFLGIKLRKARVFLKYQHLNQGYMGTGYFGAPGYPLPDSMLRVGINWRFFN